MKNKILNHKGQAVMEYLIISALIGIFCLVAFKRIGESMKTRLNNINKKIQKEIVIK